MIVDTSWQDRAACAGKPTDLFFRKSSRAAAKAVCESCPVLEQCRSWCDFVEGNGVNPAWFDGVFGGESPTTRARRRLAELEELEGAAS